MKKQLLFGFAAFASLAIVAQNSSKLPSNHKVKKMVSFKPAFSEDGISNFASPVIAGPTNKTTAAPYKRMGGSSNVLGVQFSEDRVLQYNSAINTVGFVNRIEASWIPLVTAGNSGTMNYVYSTNNGGTWDSTIIAAHSTNLHRYPSGSMYNPSGNTNPANAYAVSSGPNHVGSATWAGNYFASKQLTFPGNNTNGNVTYAINSSLTANQRKQGFARVDFQITNDGKAHVAGDIMNDANGTTNATYGWRGAMLNTGTFNAGSFTWTVDSLKPNFKLDGVGDVIGSSSYNMAWSEDGQIGYVVFYGVDANALSNTSMNSYQPFVYKTVNAGGSWARFAPLFDFSTIPSVSDRIFPAKGTVGTLLKPFIYPNEGAGTTVDANGNLHLFTSMTSSSSDNLDSLGYTYGLDYTNVWNYVVDFNTNSTGWCANVIDSLKCEGPTSDASDPSGTGNSNWLNSGSPFAYDARLQISRTTDGQFLFYSWADSDSNLVTPAHVSTLPDVFMKGYDLVANKFTATKNMSAGKTGIEYFSFWFFASTKAMRPTATSFIIPTSITLSDDNSNDAINPVSHYYIDDNGFNTSEFTVSPIGSCPATVTGIKNQTNTTFENLSFYPNPASTNATIDVVLNATSKLDISILNSVGQTVYSTSINGNIGSNKVDVNLNSLSAGLYFYQVKVANSKAITKKFAVEK